MPIRAIHHVQLAMPPGREALAVEFYEGLLGLTHVPKPPDLASRGGCWFEDGALAIHLGVEDPFVPARKAHPALLVEGLADLEVRLEAAGHPVRPGPGLVGLEQRYVDDPFGNRIELLEPIAEPLD